MLNPGLAGYIRQAFSLRHFSLVTDTFFPEILYRKDAVTAAAGMLQRSGIVQIASHDLHAPGGQCLGCGFVRIAGQCAYGKSPVEQKGNQGAALGAGGTGYQNRLCGHYAGCS